MAELSPSLYVTYLDTAMGALSLYVTTKCMTSSSTLLGEPFPLTAYAVNPSSTRFAADQNRRYIKLGADWRKEVAFPFVAYEFF